MGVIELTVGLVGVFGVARAMAGLLYGIAPNDPTTFVAVPITLAPVVFLATYLPARRAVRLDPIASLRNDCDRRAVTLRRRSLHV
jgi:putative ABC transport system permease protein